MHMIITQLSPLSTLHHIKHQDQELLLCVTSPMFGSGCVVTSDQCRHLVMVTQVAAMVTQPQ